MIMELAREITAGRRLTSREECEPLLSEELGALNEAADYIRREMTGDKVDLCCIINGRSGRCSEDCKFCAQASCNHTGVSEYSFLDTETILRDCGKYAALGVDRYSIVTAGRSLSGEDLDHAAEAYRALHERYPGMKLCGSHGLESDEAFWRMKEAGVDTVHCNVETSRHYFPQICSTHTYEDKVRSIRRAKAAGLHVCCGGIIGMGESWADRIDMALEIAELDPQSIPLNVLIPIPGTPFEDLEIMKNEDVLRTVSIFRFVNPEKQIRIAAGRFRFEDGGAALFRAGASATITGDMLTTVGNNTREDRAMFREMGFRLKPASGEEF